MLACALLTRPVDSFGQTSDALFALGVERFQKGDLAAAERAFLDVVREDPGHFDAHNNLGAVYAEQRRTDEAIKAFERAVALKPYDPHALKRLVRLLLDRGRPADAVGHATRLAAAEDSADTQALLGRSLWHSGRVAEGCRHMIAALAFDSRNSSVQIQVALCFLEAKDLDAAWLHANAVRTREPAHPMAAIVISRIEAERVNDEGDWWFYLFLVGLAAAITAAAARRADQWGVRRTALGVFALSTVTAIWALSGQVWWFAGGFWGAYQFYAAFRHWRMRAARTDERAGFMHAAGGVLACIALADGEIQPPEYRAVREAFSGRGFTDAEVDILGSAMRERTLEFNAALFDHEALYARLHSSCSEFNRLSNEAMRAQLFETAVRVALADAHATQGEMRAVEACATWLNIPKEQRDLAWRTQA